MPNGLTPIDREFLPQRMLDLPVRARLSRFPWKGQFTPELVEVLLDTYLLDGGSVLDPFVGSGTVLFEALKRGLDVYGGEVNDAALAFSRVAELCAQSPAVRHAAFARATALLERWPQHPEKRPSRRDVERVHKLVRCAREELATWYLVSAAVVLAFTLRARLVRSSVLEALGKVGEVTFEPRPEGSACAVFRADARALPLDDAVVDLVITSPPYINVHNYHQYARPAVELLGGSPLGAAKSELGANRKFRQNRFLTVIQYSIDMTQVLRELRRVIRDEGRVIIVLGRESRVRGLPFENGRMLTELAETEGSFVVTRRMERSFENRFGMRIVEDVVELSPAAQCNPSRDGRSVGVEFLKRALSRAADDGQRRDLKLAIEQAASVPASLLLERKAEGTLAA